MSHCFIRHTVADFDAWKKVFDENPQMRRSSGMVDAGVWQNEDDPNDVCMLFEVTDRDAAMAFSKSDELRQEMQRAGVQGEPTMIWLR